MRPLLLRGRPGVLATVAGACAVLAAPLAAVPLFLSSAGSASVAVQVAERCARDTGATFRQLPSAVPNAGAGVEDPFAPLGAWLGPTEGWGRLDDVMLEGTLRRRGRARCAPTCSPATTRSTTSRWWRGRPTSTRPACG